MKKQISMIALSTVAVLSLSACAGSGFVPASQTPRPYVAAHDIIDGQCRDVRLSTDKSNVLGRAMPKTVRAVECPQESGGVEDAGGVQAQSIR